jgi:hypothetical protein
MRGLIYQSGNVLKSERNETTRSLQCETNCERNNGDVIKVIDKIVLFVCKLENGVVVGLQTWNRSTETEDQ